MPRFLLCVGLLCCGLFARADSQPQPLSIAVAANFAAPLNSLLPEFEARTGIATRVTVGSSGALFAQIQHGAPFDLFLSADSVRPQALVTAGTVNAAQVYTYAIGQLALVGKVTGLADPLLLQPATRIAIADPALAPYGRAASQLLQASGHWQALAGRLIRGTNIQQTLQFWQTGNVDVAFVAASQCVSYALSCKSLPADYQPIVQQLAILGNPESARGATLLAEYLRSDIVQQQLANAGYTPLNNAQQGSD